MAFLVARIPLPFPRLIGPQAVAVDVIELIAQGKQATELALPRSWMNEEGRPAARQFRLTIPENFHAQNNSYLYIPYFEQRLRAVVDGLVIYDSLDIRFWSGPIGYLSALFALPEDLPAGKTLELYIETGIVPRGTLSRVYVGPREAFQTSYLVRSFLEERAKPMLFGAQLLLGIVSLGVFAKRPSDRVFGWLGATLIMTCVIGIGILMAYAPALERILRQTYLLAPIAGLALIGFTASLAGRPVPRAALVVFPAILVLSIAMTMHPNVTLTQAALLGAVPGFLLAVCWALFILVFSLGRNADSSLGLFLVGLVIIVYGVSHDFSVRSGLLEDGILISRIANSLVMAGMAVFLIGKQSETANSLDQAAITLRAKLAEREAELSAIYQRQKVIERQNAVSAERRRITSDLHDGVAGHLATIVALSEAGDDTAGDINISAKNALVDLRLVLDALSLPKGSIGFALGSFRERCLQPLERLGIGIHWSMTDLPDQTDHSREAILNILRILQEAVNNAVRHGEPHSLNVSGRSNAAGELWFTIENTGGKPFSPEVTGSGLGLESMRRRATAINGSILIEPTETGARVTLHCAAPKQENIEA